MNDHTHTDKTLQGNNKIESAIAALQQEPSQEMLAHTLTVIRRRMNEHGELIIAIDPSSAASGLQVQAIQTDDGRKWWAAFTSFDEELKGSGSVMSTFLTDMKQLFNSAITADNIQGIIINPWNRTIMLDKALLRIILIVSVPCVLTYCIILNSAKHIGIPQLGIIKTHAGNDKSDRISCLFRGLERIKERCRFLKRKCVS